MIEPGTSMREYDCQCSEESEGEVSPDHRELQARPPSPMEDHQHGNSQTTRDSSVTSLKFVNGASFSCRIKLCATNPSCLSVMSKPMPCHNVRIYVIDPKRQFTTKTLTNPTNIHGLTSILSYDHDV